MDNLYNQLIVDCSCRIRDGKLSLWDHSKTPYHFKEYSKDHPYRGGPDYSDKEFYQDEKVLFASESGWVI